MADPRVVNRHHRPACRHVYVGRPTIYGNPFVVGTHGGRGECLALYRRWLDGGMPEFESERRRRLLTFFLPMLARKVRDGYSLACWCAPQACHAEVLLERIDAMPETIR